MSDILKATEILREAEAELGKVLGYAVELFMRPAESQSESKEQHLIKVCCKALGITVKEFTGKNQEREFSDARIIISWLLVRECNTTRKRTAQLTNGCDHSTITNRIKTYHQLYDTNQQFQAKVKACEMALNTTEEN